MTHRSSPESAEGFTGTRWRHLKRGTSYEVVGVAKLQTALTEGLADETPMVVYRDEATNKLSVRSLDEFCDGRFEKLGRAAHAQGRTIRLEARLADDSQDWVEIFPAQLEWAAKQGHQVRALEVSAVTSTNGGGA